MKKIVHIHTDAKFIENSFKRFNSDKFENYLIFIGDRRPDSLSFKGAIQLPSTKTTIKKAVNYCKKADLVIAYDLDIIKSRIINILPNNIKIAWRFFGYELYGRKKKLYYSNMTMEVLQDKTSSINKVFNYFIRIIRSYFSYFKWGSSHEEEFHKAIKRINYFLGFYEEEYLYLKEMWSYLPKFFEIPLRKPSELNSGYSGKKNPSVIIGNSRNANNNHLDILNIVKNSSPNKDIDFLMLFNYGQDYEYADAVRKESKSIEQLVLIEEFLTLQEFKKMYSSIGALVINGYRQMALGNICQALGSGVKIYLNKKNTLYDYLENNYFKIFSINDFKSDIKSGDIILDTDLRVHNYKGLQSLYLQKTYTCFQNEILKLMK